MLELVGNIWDLRRAGDIVAVTTNGFVTKNGACVMGRGIAQQVKTAYPMIPFQLGNYIRRFGNRPFRLHHDLASFPVKPSHIVYRGTPNEIVGHMRNKFNAGDFVPGWACVADIDIIADSAVKLRAMADKFSWSRILIPRPGCGAGELSWSVVNPVLCDLLDNRFFACNYR